MLIGPGLEHEFGQDPKIESIQLRQRLIGQSVAVAVQGLEQFRLPSAKLPEIGPAVAVAVAHMHVGVALIVDYRPDLPIPVLVVIVSPTHQPFVDPLFHVVDHAVAIFIVVSKEKTRCRILPFVPQGVDTAVGGQDDASDQFVVPGFIDASGPIGGDVGDAPDPRGTFVDDFFTLIGPGFEHESGQDLKIEPIHLQQRLVGQSVAVAVQGLEQLCFAPAKLPEIEPAVAVAVAHLHVDAPLLVNERKILPAPVLVIVVQKPREQNVVDPLFVMVEHAVLVLVAVMEQEQGGGVVPLVPCDVFQSVRIADPGATQNAVQKIQLLVRALFGVGPVEVDDPVVLKNGAIIHLAILVGVRFDDPATVRLLANLVHGLAGGYPRMGRKANRRGVFGYHHLLRLRRVGDFFPEQPGHDGYQGRGDQGVAARVGMRVVHGKPRTVPGLGVKGRLKIDQRRISIDRGQPLSQVQKDQVVPKRLAGNDRVHRHRIGQDDRHGTLGLHPRNQRLQPVFVTLGRGTLHRGRRR